MIVKLIMKVATVLFSASLTFCAVSVYGQGLGISSEVYAKRFNSLAEKAEMPEDFRLRSAGAQVTSHKQRTVASIKVDGKTTLHLGYGGDLKRMTDIVMVRPIGQTQSERLETIKAITVALQAVYETPDQRGSALAVQACGEAVETGKSASRKYRGRIVNCHTANGALMMEIS